jgi:ABC-type uncharacterized transport system auxiliary subunit
MPETHYFTLEWQQLSTPASSDAVLLVQRFDAVPTLKNDRMMYKTSLYEIKYDNFRRWAMPPSLLLSQKAADYFSASDLFKHAVQDLPRGATHSLFGYITHFEEIDYGGQHKVLVSINFELSNMDDSKPLLTTTISKEVDVAAKSAESIVQAMSMATKLVLDDLSSEIQTVLN